MNAVKTLSVRLPFGIYERAACLAEARNQSLNRLIQDGLQLLDAQDREKRLFDDFSAIADAGDANVGPVFAAQAETLGEP